MARQTIYESKVAICIARQFLFSPWPDWGLRTLSKETGGHGVASGENQKFGERDHRREEK
jgi:hypothetical protein